MTILNTSLVILIVIIGMFYYTKKRKKENTKLSFKEAMDLTELPVVTFYNGSTKINFLLDTGSNDNIINKDYLKKLEYHLTNEVSNTIGVEGNSIESNSCFININYKKNNFNEKFNIIDMSEAFESIKKESGVSIHGILGSKFFERNKYILNFKELIIHI